MTIIKILTIVSFFFTNDINFKVQLMNESQEGVMILKNGNSTEFIYNELVEGKGYVTRIKEIETVKELKNIIEDYRGKGFSVKIYSETIIQKFD